MNVFGQFDNKDVSVIVSELLVSTVDASDALRVGAHLSTPIVVQDGRSYGTLCCFSASPNPALNEKDLRTLRNCAVLVARKLELAADRGIAEPPAERAIEPTTVYESRIWELR